MYNPFLGPLGDYESWEMFALTGNPAYYMLYKNITGKDDSELTEEEKQRR